MNTLLQFLSEAKNTHLEHLEDDIINNGVVGGRNAINFLVALKDILEANKARINARIRQCPLKMIPNYEMTKLKDGKIESTNSGNCEAQWKD